MSSIRVGWVGHSTVVLDLDGVRILTDPLLHAHAGLLRRAPAPPDPASWHGTDAVLVSHLHHDHAELRSLRRLPDVPILTSPVNAAWLRRRGLDAAVGLGEDWAMVGSGSGSGSGPGPGPGEVGVRLVEATHHHRPMPHRPNDANGHLVRGPSGTVWFAGDTSLHGAMASLPERAGGRVDVAVVPVWGWGPRLSEGHMDPFQAAEACARVGARWAVPVHWGTLHPPLVARFARAWLERPGEEFAEALGRRAPGCTPLVLAPGEVAALPLDPESPRP